MIPLTLKARAATFPLDQLLAVKRRGRRVCLICGSDGTPAGYAQCVDCQYGAGPMLADPDDLIILNWGPNNAAAH